MDCSQVKSSKGREILGEVDNVPDDDLTQVGAHETQGCAQGKNPVTQDADLAQVGAQGNHRVDQDLPVDTRVAADGDVARGLGLLIPEISGRWVSENRTMTLQWRRPHGLIGMLTTGPIGSH